MRFFDGKIDIRTLSPLTLAYIGDGVFEIMTREYALLKESAQLNRLHLTVTQKVCASAQANAAHKILDRLSEKELGFFRRGRNAQPGHVPKNADVSDYHYATGLECLFGYLYLEGEKDRLTELFLAIVSEDE